MALKDSKNSLSLANLSGGKQFKEPEEVDLEIQKSPRKENSISKKSYVDPSDV
jgi:hypothetical protein